MNFRKRADRSSYVDAFKVEGVLYVLEKGDPKYLPGWILDGKRDGKIVFHRTCAIIPSNKSPAEDACAQGDDWLVRGSDGKIESLSDTKFHDLFERGDGKQATLRVI